MTIQSEECIVCSLFGLSAASYRLLVWELASPLPQKKTLCVLDNGNDITAVTFMLRVEGPGTGNLPDECTDLRTSMKAIKGKLSLILSISEHDDIEIIRCFLNGIRREMVIEPEELRSTLFITDKPWRSRIFSIGNKIDNDDYFEEDDDTHVEKDDSENGEDIDKRTERANSNVDMRKE